jgi:protein-disulfide isomerase
VPLLEQVFERNQESIKIVYKNLPLRNHKMAKPAALAALAANEQGKFWEYHDKLFAETKILPESIDRIATELGLDIDRFKNDIRSTKLQNIIKRDIAEANKYGVTGTPTVFINGRKLKQRSLNGFQSIIDDELKKLN